MALTLKSLQTDMQNGFAKVNNRIDDTQKEMREGFAKVDGRFTEVNNRIDRILIRLDDHIKETAFNFREVNERFELQMQEIGKRFDQLTNDIASGFSRHIDCIEEMIDAQEIRINNHEDRIIVLEKTVKNRSH